jgi:hypothetical protein
VPYDFDWSLERAITDNDFFRLYSELPFSARFSAILDCCHAGGMTRDHGLRDGVPRMRGLTPPDDIRHRQLQWDGEQQCWSSRSLRPISVRYRRTADAPMTGLGRATYRLGRGMRLRGSLNRATEQRLISQQRGLYLPVLFEACGEGELAQEYRHGAESYGAFTWTLAAAVRRAPRLSWERLQRVVSADFAVRGYNQRPVLVGASAPLRRRALS